MAVAALVIGAVASVAGTVISFNAQKKAAKKQQKQQELASRRSRRQAIRQSQLLRAQAQASAQGSGTLQSSGASGGIGSLSSQLGTQLGFESQMTALSRGISKDTQRANFGSGLAQLGGGLVNFGVNQGASFEGIFSSFKKPTVKV